MNAQYEAELSCEQLEFVVTGIRPVKSKNIYALLDVEMMISGVSFLIRGLQARRLVSGGTSIHLPTYKDVDGRWQAAVVLPVEVRGPLFKAVLDLLVTEGHAKEVVAS